MILFFESQSCNPITGHKNCYKIGTMVPIEGFRCDNFTYNGSLSFTNVVIEMLIYDEKYYRIYNIFLLSFNSSKSFTWLYDNRISAW